MASTLYHIPALLEESIEGLNINPSGTYIDATFGGGGHSRAILEKLDAAGRLYGFDQDLDARANVPNDERFTFVHSNFRYAENFMRYYNALPVDGILADLGVSFHHFDTTERGFSFRTDAPLDMRMNTKSELTAADIVNTYSEEQLTALLRLYGDFRNPRPIVRAIIARRAEHPIATTLELAETITPALNPRQLKKELAQAFQALRIEVNGEMTALRKFLEQTPHLLREGGRLAILTYHSLEDRMVKNFMRSGNVEGNIEKDFYGNVSTPWRLVTRQPLTASAEEIERNPRARSAKLRVAELIRTEPSDS